MDSPTAEQIDRGLGRVEYCVELLFGEFPCNTMLQTVSNASIRRWLRRRGGLLAVRSVGTGLVAVELWSDRRAHELLCSPPSRIRALPLVASRFAWIGSRSDEQASASGPHESLWSVATRDSTHSRTANRTPR
jgi:hypothetical protein